MKAQKTTSKPKAKKAPPSRKKGGPKEMDVHIGNRLRMRRTIIGWSQEKLAESVGLTFQQVQKYERGANRISGSRLYEFSIVLGVGTDYFFDQFDKKQKPSDFKYGFSDGDQAEHLKTGKWYDKETLELIRTYYSISDRKTRRLMLKMIETTAGMAKKKNG